MNRLVKLVVLTVSCSTFAHGGTDELAEGQSFPQVFNESSPWNQAIPANAAIDPLSEAMITNLIWQFEHLQKIPSIGVNTRDWSSPIHLVDFDSAPKVDVVSLTGSAFYPTVDPDGNGIAESIPMSPSAWADPQEDGHMILVDINKKQVYEFSRASFEEGEYLASRVDFWDLSGLGVREVSGPVLPHNYWMSGVRGSGTPFIAGLIRYDEMQAGVINHALAISSMNTRKRNESSGHGLDRELCGYSTGAPGQVGVASRSDGLWQDNGPVEGGWIFPEYNHWITGASLLQGQRIRLKRHVDIEALSVGEAAKIVLRALQTYGAFVVDNAVGFNIYFENLGADTDKWFEIEGVSEVSSIDLNLLEVIACDTPVYFRDPQPIAQNEEEIPIPPIVLVLLGIIFYGIGRKQGYTKKLSNDPT